MTAAMIGVLAFAWLTLFQVVLAAGAPLGRLAWGGVHRTLPTQLRVASAVSALVAVLALITVAQSGGMISPLLPGGWLRPILWVLVALFGLSVLANLFGAKGLERLHGVPLALLCAGSCLALVLA
ncbi:hypothetical protein [Nioella aestuarii]|uniref:hypothetical protein n=1 Tax=Nioella aestuarii TaxID=1662864 RepID=UPI003D7FDDED